MSSNRENRLRDAEQSAGNGGRDITIFEQTVRTIMDPETGERREVVEEVPADQWEYSQWNDYGTDGSRIRFASRAEKSRSGQ